MKRTTLLGLILSICTATASAAPPSTSVFSGSSARSTPQGGHRAPIPAPKFTFTVNGTNFMYADHARTFTGVFLKPAGNGPFPAAIVSHGQGGSAVGYSLGKAQEFLAWGLVSVAPNYTHAAGGATLPAETGNCPENIARGLACLNVLESLDFVDTSRIVLWGHSKGAYATIGLAAAAPFDFAAAGMSAGGIIPDSAGASNAAPTVTEAAPVLAPFIMFHGNADPVVSPSQSLLFEERLDAALVPNQRILYATNQHNLHQVPDINADMLSNFRTWLETYGVLR